MTFATACFLAYLWSSYFIPETANVSLEEMDAVFNSSASVADERLKAEVRGHPPLVTINSSRLSD
jgi:hypothetical protein